MTINTQNNELISVEEYFNLLNQEELNEIQQFQKRRFENFIQNCENYLDVLTDETKKVYADYQKGFSKLYTKENRTNHEENLLMSYERKMEEIKTDEVCDEYTRKLSKAGYVNATIILVMILNIGFIIAMALLGSK